MSHPVLAQPIRILLVEDNQADARFIETLLCEASKSTSLPRFVVETVQRLSAGLARLAAGPVDLVLLDLSLPDSLGLSTFVHINRQAPYTPVIILTGLDDEALAIQALGMGAQDYLVKGEVDGPLLTRAIRYAIERKRAEEDLRRHRDHLEELVTERTADLVRVNERLLQEIVERKRAEELLTRRNEELAALNTAIQAVVSRLELREILELLLREAINLTGAWGASVLLYDGAREELEFITVVDPVAEQLVGTRMPASEGIAGWVLREQRAALVRNAQQDPRFYRGIDQLTGLTTGSILALPLRVKERVIGVVELINKMGGPFDEHDLELMETLTGAAASAIENAQLLEAVSLGKRKWEVTFDAIADGIVVVDRDWHITCINSALAGWLQSTAEELTGRSCQELALQNERMALLLGHMQAFQGMRPQSMEVSISQTGEELLVSMYPLHSDIGPDSAVYVVKDITERKQMERWLIHSERLTAMGRLAASIAHEINNPLQSVSYTHL
ncbi:MAG: GAF domain-containing protein, partial [Anaerolineae bacterium]|nr:GAF domain-containing protein [Anaerolineae bacterium]